MHHLKYLGTCRLRNNIDNETFISKYHYVFNEVFVTNIKLWRLFKIRLLRNRVSAQQARERKKVYVNDLESRAKDLHDRNSNLEERISTMINENNMLRKDKGPLISKDKGPLIANLDQVIDETAESDVSYLKLLSVVQFPFVAGP
ncbi:hypothetical protein Scep_008705 [Stephania cephalantha]|uniref:BZIP domain-containing protein n=1 Tax=Stephania cephalantha TaxID=152367 RepID=A0AAP0JSH7_9MAGN